MKTQRFFLSLLAAAALTAVGVANARAGNYGITVPSEPGVTIWDMSGGYEPSVYFEDDGDETFIDYGMTVLQSGKGTLSGTGYTDVKIDSPAGVTTISNCKYKVSGSVTTSGALGKFTCKVSITGKGLMDGKIRTVSLSVTYTFYLDQDEWLMYGKQSAKASASGYGSVSAKEDIETALPEDVTGETYVDADYTVAKKITGTVWLELANGRELPFSLSGSTSTKTGKSSVTITGKSKTSASGSKVSVSLDEDGDITKLSGSILGCKIKFPYY